MTGVNTRCLPFVLSNLIKLLHLYYILLLIVYQIILFKKLMLREVKEYPILNVGEGLVVSMDDGQTLTNYRYIYNEGGSLINIPLHNLLHYDIVTDADDTRQDLKIQYLRNGKEETLRIDSWIKDEIVRAVRNAGEFENLNAEQKAILETSHYELSKIGINAPVIGLLPKTPEKGCFDNNKKS